MTNLREERVRGEHAKALLEDPLLAQAFKQITKDCHAEWLASAPEDTATRERLYLTARVTEYLQSYLRGLLVDGELAKQRLEDIKEYDVGSLP